MKDRGMIKWAPFSSVIPPEVILDELKNKRSKVNKPILSTDQLTNLNDSLKEYYLDKETVQIKYYYEGFIKEIKGIIKNIDITTKKLTIDGQIIYISQILEIKTLAS